MCMWEPDSFVLELIAVDAHSTSSVSSCSVTSLHHELFDDSMELVSLVVVLFTLLACAESSEVFSSLGYFLRV